MKNLRLLPLLLLALAVQSASAQSYITAAGFRIDNGIDLTVQQLIANKWTLEGMVHTSFRSDDLGITLLGERHHKVLSRNLNFYYGAGPHYYWTNGNTRLDTDISKNVAGLSFIGGAELSLGRFNVSFDYKPELHLSGETVHPFEWTGAAVSVRYIFVKRPKHTLKDMKLFDKFDKDLHKNNRRFFD